MLDPGIRAGVRRLFRLPPRTEARARADADEELESFIAARTEDLIARGADPAAARAEAMRRLGGGATVEEVRQRLYHSAARRERRLHLRDALAGLRQDVRFALRQLARTPGFTAVAVLTLALGLGASAAIFSAVYPVLIAPLPYPHAGRIVTIWDHAPDGSRLDVTFGTHRELEARSRLFEATAVMRLWQPATSGAEEPERLDGQRVTAGYFRVLGVPPAIGRDFDPTDDRLGAPRVAILSDRLWRRRFGGDRAVVGRQVTLNGDAYTVVGVMPRGFENVPALSAELWSTLR
ncbi:MAG TPA: ABC transporter permease, partial [Gemmatimonadaceae bacterium]|nr:ABC transporter permease [Gemmatimonadaceae bacterium]